MFNKKYSWAPVVILTAIWRVYAHDPNVPVAQWMMSLIQPHKMIPCCGPGDQFYVREYEPSNKPGIAFHAIVIGMDGAPDFQEDIPESTVIWGDRANPTGRGVVFIGSNEFDTSVLCFVPAVAA